MKVFSKGNDPRVWEREVTALQAVDRYNLSHVVGVKAMFTQSSIFHLVLPWAHGGNLIDFWTRHDSYHDRRLVVAPCIRAILVQLVEISRSLAFLHNFSYRHGDLKPENILIFWANENVEDIPGTWMMADFGLAKEHVEATGKRNHMIATSIRGWGTISYKAPEVFRNPNSPTSRLFDIWSMGCIILQFITWLVHGMVGVRKLTQKTISNVGNLASCFWDGDYVSGRWYSMKVHREVIQLILELKEHLKASPALLDLLAVVETGLLVIETPQDPGMGTQQCRTDARGLFKSLQRICQNCQNNPSYWTRSAEVVRWTPTFTQMQGSAVNPQQGMNAHQGMIPQQVINVQQRMNAQQGINAQQRMNVSL